MSPLEQYNSIIDYWQKNPLVKGGEEHHIIPQSLGGPDVEWNKVRMPTLEHIRCHRLLKEIYKGKFSIRMDNAYTCMRKTRQGIVLTDEEAAESRDAAKVPHDEEWNQNISKALKGKPKSEEHRMNISKSHKGKTTWMKGKKHKEASKRKMSLKRKGKVKGPQTDEWRKHISEGLTGKPKSDEHRKHLSEAMTGKKQSEERRRKHSEEMKAYWARKKAAG